MCTNHFFYRYEYDVTNFGSLIWKLDSIYPPDFSTLIVNFAVAFKTTTATLDEQQGRIRITV